MDNHLFAVRPQGGRRTCNLAAGLAKADGFLATMFCLAIVMSLLLRTTQAEVRYTLTNLGLGHSQYVEPVAINNGGRVVGIYDTPSLEGASFIYRNGNLRDLGTLAGYSNYVTAINNFGQIVGYYEKLDDFGLVASRLAYRRSPDGHITFLGSLDNASDTEALGINDCGTIIGSSGKYGFVYQNGLMTKLESFQGHSLENALAINNRGQILAIYLDARSNYRTIIYSGGQMRDIGSPNGHQDALGTLINDHGIVVGSYTGNPDSTKQGQFLYSGVEFRDLGVTYRTLEALNNCGQFVGSDFSLTTFHSIAILFNGAKEEDLNTLIDPKMGVYLYDARGVNDFGQICASGIDADGFVAAYLLTPIRACHREH